MRSNLGKLLNCDAQLPLSATAEMYLKQLEMDVKMKMASPLYLQTSQACNWAIPIRIPSCRHPSCTHHFFIVGSSTYQGRLALSCGFHTPFRDRQRIPQWLLAGNPRNGSLLFTCTKPWEKFWEYFRKEKDANGEYQISPGTRWPSGYAPVSRELSIETDIVGKELIKSL